MANTDEYRHSHLVQLTDLTAEKIEETLLVFHSGGWDETGLAGVRQEMVACVKGDIPGYARPRFILAMVNDQVVGAAAWAPSMCSFDMYELSWATVLPAWRHRGINTLMLNGRLKKIRAQHGPGSLDVIVCTWPNAMYAIAGFTPLFAPGEYYDETKKERILLRAHLKK